MKFSYPLFAITGCPNSGKTALFNSLCGQSHTCCNWPGSTTEPAVGRCGSFQDTLLLLDLPSSNTLRAGGTWETITGDLLACGLADGILVVCSCLSLERGLSYLKQLTALDQVRNAALPLVLCLSFWKEAKAQGISVDTALLSDVLQIPVLPFVPESREKCRLIADACREGLAPPRLPCPYHCLDFSPGVLARAVTTRALRAEHGRRSESCCAKAFCVKGSCAKGSCALLWLLLLFGSLWAALSFTAPLCRLMFQCFCRLEIQLLSLRTWQAPWAQTAAALIATLLRPLAWAFAAALPPMMVLLPLGVLLEETGLIPRMVMALDRLLEICGMCTRQGFALLAGLAWESWGISCCRLIAGAGNRLNAFWTNALIPCFGKLPAAIFLALCLTLPNAAVQGFWAAAFLLTLALGICLAACLGTSFLLNRFLLPARASFYPLELTPCRCPLKRSLAGKLFSPLLALLGCTAVHFLPLEILGWIMALIPCPVRLASLLPGGGLPPGGSLSLLHFTVSLLQPAGNLLGLDGAILLAFLLGTIGNEIFLPVLFSIYLLTAPQEAGGLMAEKLLLPGLAGLPQLLSSAGWTWRTALCTFIFLLFHWPEAKSLAVIRRDTGSIFCCLIAVLIPSVIGVAVCVTIGLLL